ncbi:MAG: hypothetical protein AUG51_19155 [Acidobacteria bacterium 13_1_20CM_3_53_8]|nr:MAG: hypothetical protein AUG51_19155 [Acidobacteria bacterium 13_1_20CM_3_53_8]
MLMFICSGDACGDEPGDGDDAGIFMPGIFSICSGEALGEGFGVGDEEGVGDAIGICMPGMLPISSCLGLVVCFFFGVGVGLGWLIPGMLCP